MKLPGGVFVTQITLNRPGFTGDFFARFLARPNARARRDFCFNLLDLEIDRVQYNVFLVPPLFEVSDQYRSDIARARRALRFARMFRWRDHEDLDLPYCWLMLMGHRLAVERGLSVGGVEALAHMACRRLNLPLTETELWSDDELFAKYTRTVLRAEWDYPGLQFRLPETPPLGAA